MTKWQRIRTYTLAELGLISWAALLLGGAWLCLPWVRFVPAGVRSPQLGSPPIERGCAEVAARLVGVASRHFAVEVTCLHRALVLWWILRRRGVDGAIHLGTRSEPGPFEAHAWVTCDGVPIGENAEYLGSFHAFERELIPTLRLISRRKRPPETLHDASTQGRFGP